jgi:hypothetical protein
MDWSNMTAGLFEDAIMKRKSTRTVWNGAAYNHSKQQSAAGATALLF